MGSLTAVNTKGSHACHRAPKISQASATRFPKIPSLPLSNLQSPHSKNTRSVFLNQKTSPCAPHDNRKDFEILLESINDVEVVTKALVVIGNLVNVDPSRKIIAYQEDNETNYPALENSHDLPSSIDHMNKHISAPLTQR